MSSSEPPVATEIPQTLNKLMRTVWVLFEGGVCFVQRKRADGCGNSSRARSIRRITVFIIIMVIPATNAVSEHSKSAVRRIKTYLRSTMSQLRLLVLHIHKEKTDNLDLIARLFVETNINSRCSVNFKEDTFFVPYTINACML